MGQLSFADVDPLADVSLRETTFVVVDLETTGGRASGEGHDCITEIGAVKVRGGAVLGELATLVDPGRSIPPQIVALTGITSAMVYNAPHDRGGTACIPRVLPRRGAGRPQRRLRHRVPACCRRTLPDRLAATAGVVHRPAGPPGAHSRRGAQRAAGRAGPVVRRRHHPDAPGTRRRARHRRRAARADRADRQPGRANLHRAALISARRDTRPAPQPPPRHHPAALPGRVSVPRARRPRCSTSVPLSICADASANTSTAPTRAHASRRWRRWPPRSTTSSVRTTSKPECVNCDCSSRTHRRTTAGRSFRTGGGGWYSPTSPFHGFLRYEHRNSTPRSGRSARAPTPSRPPRCWPGSPACGRAPPGWPDRPGTARVCPERELSPCPALRDITAVDYAAAPVRAAELIDGESSRALADVLGHITELAERNRYETAARLRDHAATAIDVLWRGQRLRALAARRRKWWRRAPTATADGTWR